MDMEMDLAIAVDDSINTWTQTTFAEDTGRPLVVVNHGTTEEYGMKDLSDQLEIALKNYEVLHFKQGCSYQWIASEWNIPRTQVEQVPDVDIFLGRPLIWYISAW